MTVKNRVDIKDLFSGLQNQITTTLAGNRKVILHPGAKGDSAELHWLEMLKTYLPGRYMAAKAFVIDVRGHLSEQIDVVIFDRQYSPFIFHDRGATYVPAESVYAVFEVKQELNKDYLKYAGKKLSSVRSLVRTSAKIHHAGGVFKPKKPFPILGGILTLDSAWAPPLGASFRKVFLNQKGTNRLDIGCCALKGSFVRDGGRLRISDDDNSLLFFFLHLLRALQRLGTVPALDFDRYLKTLSL